MNRAERRAKGAVLLSYDDSAAVLWLKNRCKEAVANGDPLDPEKFGKEYAELQNKKAVDNNKMGDLRN